MQARRGPEFNTAGVGVVQRIHFRRARRSQIAAQLQGEHVAQVLAEHLHEHVAQLVDAHQSAEAYGAEHVSGGGIYRTMRRCRKKACREVGIGGGDRKCRTTGGSHGVEFSFFSQPSSLLGGLWPPALTTMVLQIRGGKSIRPTTKR